MGGSQAASVRSFQRDRDAETQGGSAGDGERRWRRGDAGDGEDAGGGSRGDWRGGGTLETGRALEGRGRWRRGETLEAREAAGEEGNAGEGEALESGGDAGDGRDAADRLAAIQAPRVPHVSICSCLHPHKSKRTGKLGALHPKTGVSVCIL